MQVIIIIIISLFIVNKIIKCCWNTIKIGFSLLKSTTQGAKVELQLGKILRLTKELWNFKLLGLLHWDKYTWFLPTGLKENTIKDKTDLKLI